MPLLALVALVVAAFAAPLAKAVPSATPRVTYTTNGIVKATAKAGNTLYIGGTFTEVGPRTGPAAAMDSTTGKLVSTPQISGGAAEVKVVEPDGEGGYYVGGRFNWAGGEAHKGIVHVKADGSVDPAFAPQVTETVYAIARDGSTVYIAGRFFDINGEARRSVAALDATTGELLPWAPELDPSGNPEVFAIAASGEYVYFGGSFSKVNGETRVRLAAVKAGGSGNEAADVSGWNPTPNGYVQALTVSGSTLYMGGLFTKMNGLGEAERKYLAAFNLSAGGPGEPEMTAWSPLASNAVYAVAVSEDGETVYAGGKFTQVNGETRKYVAAIDTAGALTAWSPETNGEVHGVAVSASTVYAAGSFSTAGGEARNNVAAFEAAGAGALSSWSPGLVGSGAESVAVSGSTVVAGGLFSGVNAESHKYLAAIDLTTGKAMSWNPEPNGEVWALAANESTVYAAGVFSLIGGASRSRLGAVDAVTGEATVWNPGSGQNVSQMLLEGEAVWLAGGFTTIAGKTRNHVAAVDATTGVASAFNPPTMNNGVEDFAIVGETMYIGGQFTEIGSAPHGGLAALDKSTGAVQAWNPALSSSVFAVAADESTVYVGGQFTSAGGEPRNHLASFNVETGELTTWNPNANGNVRAIGLGGSAVYVGGEFSKVGEVSRNRLAAVDAATGALTSWDPSPSSTVEALLYDGSSLYVGGNIRTFEHGYQQGFAVFTEPTLTVATAGAGSGSVTSAPAGIECGSTCSSGFSTGEEVTLTATPAGGSEFAGWSGGGCSGTGTCVVTVNADTEVTATFAVASGPEGGGEGSGGSGGSGGGASGSGGSGGSASGGSASGGGSASSGGAWINTRIKKAKIKHAARGTAGFWFFAKGSTAKRFECSLVKKPARVHGHKVTKRPKVHFKRCGMHRRIYRHLKPGRYVFRVRAVGAKAWDHKPAKRKFRIR